MHRWLAPALLTPMAARLHGVSQVAVQSIPAVSYVSLADFVNYFYNTVQGTLAMDWPTSGDAVLAWWAEIATWTGVSERTIVIGVIYSFPDPC